MQFDNSLMYFHKSSSAISSYIKGIYKAKYYKSDDVVSFGKDGQNVRFTFNDIVNCSVVEIFALPKPVEQRYSDYFQKTYGKVVTASRNIIPQFKFSFNPNIVGSFTAQEKSVFCSINDVNVLYNENSEVKLNNAVLGNELYNVLNDILDVLDNINIETAKHVHPNVGTPVQWRVSKISNKITSIRDSLPKILSQNNILN